MSEPAGPSGSQQSASPVPLGISTTLKASTDVYDRAQERAHVWGLPFFDRRKDSMATMYAHAEALLLFAAEGVLLSTADGQLRVSLSTAAIRLRHIAANESDPLIRAAELRPGDSVVDCTYGLGRDAVVAAHIIGPTGTLVGIEASKALFHLADENDPLAQQAGAIDVEAATISLVHSDARAWLEQAPAQSADVVLIDPMFEKPKTSDASFSILRSVASEIPLDQEWVASARRVARRWVVVKSGSWPPWFDDIGLVNVHSHGNAQWFRVAGREIRRARDRW